MKVTMECKDLIRNRNQKNIVFSPSYEQTKLENKQKTSR